MLPSGESTDLGNNGGLKMTLVFCGGKYLITPWAQAAAAVRGSHSTYTIAVHLLPLLVVV
jgi:hypothetical protein